jgi:hypothetical protein
MRPPAVLEEQGLDRTQKHACILSSGVTGYVYPGGIAPVRRAHAGIFVRARPTDVDGEIQEVHLPPLKVGDQSLEALEHRSETLDSKAMLEVKPTKSTVPGQAAP